MKTKIVSVILILVASLFTACSKQETWSKMKDNKEFDACFGQTIDQLVLRETVDSSKWVVTKDEDMIAEWKAFLEEIDIKKAKAKDVGTESGGGGSVLVVCNGETETSFIFSQEADSEYVTIDHTRYECKANVAKFFEKSFAKGVERGETTTPWDEETEE